MGVTRKLAEKITSLLNVRGIIAEKDADLYKYGIESGISIAGNFLVSLIFVLITGRLGISMPDIAAFYWWQFFR